MNPDDISDPKYRYTLWREVDPLNVTRLCWVMLNPSTADDTVDDPTIRRVIRFTRDAGYGELVVVNLFAARSTRPVHLREMADPVGPNNNNICRAAIEGSHGVVFAWGVNVENVQRARPGVESFARHALVAPMCLGKTKAGYPKHPLYVPANQQLVAY